MKQKVPVTMRAIVQRINRKLAPNMEKLLAARSERVRLDLGDYYVVDQRRNFLIHKDVDPETYAREIGVLAEWEKLT